VLCLLGGGTNHSAIEFEANVAQTIPSNNPFGRFEHAQTGCDGFVPKS
jgi:hypothetical protein